VAANGVLAETEAQALTGTVGSALGEGVFCAIGAL
jgi:hypothetical protein